MLYQGLRSINRKKKDHTVRTFRYLFESAALSTFWREGWQFSCSEVKLDGCLLRDSSLICARPQELIKTKIHERDLLLNMKEVYQEMNR